MNEPAGAGPGASRREGRRRWTQLLAGLLAALLGFGIVAATRPAPDDAVLATARESDLVWLLDDLDQRQQRLEAQRQDLLSAEARLTSTDEQERIAEARRRADALAVLAGTAPATGAGILMTIGDPERRVLAATLLNAVQELRDAGAVAMSIGDQRVVVDTWFVDGQAPGTVEVSGVVVLPPYVFRVVGDPTTMETAMLIPGGVADTVRTDGGTMTITARDELTVSALRPLRTPQYAAPVRPAPSP